MEPSTVPPDYVPPDVEVSICNVTCHFSVGCNLHLREIANKGYNVEHRGGKVNMKLRKPQMTATIWGNGSIVCVGAASEEDALVGARRVARVIQKMGFDVKLRRLRIVNMLGVCSMPFAIKINAFARNFREATYEPELHPAFVIYKLAPLKASLNIFATGSVTVSAPTTDNIQQAIERIYPMVFEYRKELPPADAKTMRSRKRVLALQSGQQQQQQ